MTSASISKRLRYFGGEADYGWFDANRITGRGNGRRLRFAGVDAAERPFRYTDLNR
jgi:hypothetical protein